MSTLIHRDEDFQGDSQLLFTENTLRERLFEAVLHSINKHAKNCRDAQREARDELRYAQHRINWDTFTDDEEYYFMHGEFDMITSQGKGFVEDMGNHYDAMNQAERLKDELYGMKDKLINLYLGDPICSHYTTRFNRWGQCTYTFYDFYKTENHSFHRPVWDGSGVFLHLGIGDLYVPGRSTREILSLEFCLEVAGYLIDNHRDITREAFAYDDHPVLRQDVFEDDLHDAVLDILRAHQIDVGDAYFVFDLSGVPTFEGFVSTLRENFVVVNRDLEIVSWDEVISLFNNGGSVREFFTLRAGSSTTTIEKIRHRVEQVKKKYPQTLQNKIIMRDNLERKFLDGRISEEKYRREKKRKKFKNPNQFFVVNKIFGGHDVPAYHVGTIPDVDELYVAAYLDPDHDDIDAWEYTTNTGASACEFYEELLEEHMRTINFTELAVQWLEENGTADTKEYLAVFPEEIRKALDDLEQSIVYAGNDDFDHLGIFTMNEIHDAVLRKRKIPVKYDNGRYEDAVKVVELSKQLREKTMVNISGD